MRASLLKLDIKDFFGLFFTCRRSLEDAIILFYEVIFLEKNASKKKIEYGGKPIGIIYFLLVFILGVHFRVKYRFKVDKKGIKGLKPPFIVLGNHPSYIDPFIMAAALLPHKINFVTSNFYFRNPKLRSFLEAMGCIPKIQFRTDMRAIRLIKKVILNGGSVGIFPEGQRSIDGSSFNISNGISKLVKLYKLPVVLVKANGAYLSWPRWSPKSRRGHIECNVNILLNPEEISNMDVVQIHNTINNALSYNDYEWNRIKKVPFKGKKIAENLHYILHQCPKCNSRLSMKSRKNTLYCSTCGNTAVMDRYGFLHPENKDCVIFEDAAKWYSWQTENMLELIKKDDFSINAKVKELKMADAFEGEYKSAGFGEITLKKDGLHFEGIVNNEPRESFFPINNIWGISADLGSDFEICDGNQAWWFFFEDGQKVIEFNTAISLFYQMKS